MVLTMTNEELKKIVTETHHFYTAVPKKKSNYNALFYDEARFMEGAIEAHTINSRTHQLYLIYVLSDDIKPTTGIVKLKTVQVTLLAEFETRLIADDIEQVWGDQ